MRRALLATLSGKAAGAVLPRPWAGQSLASLPLGGVAAAVWRWLLLHPLLANALPLLLYLPADALSGKLHMHDLEVYWVAAGRLLHGGRLILPEVDGHYSYKYSPAAAVLFLPLQLFPFDAAKAVYWVALALGIAWLLKALAARLARDHGLAAEAAARTSLLAGLVLVTHTGRDLHLGQVNYLLAGSYAVAGMLLTTPERSARGSGLAGLLLGAGLHIKPFGLIFLPWLLLRGRFAALGAMAAGALLLGLAPALFQGWDNTLVDYHRWLEIMREAAGAQSLGGPTVFGLLAACTPLGGMVAGGRLPVWGLKLGCVLLLGLAMAWMLWAGRRLGARGQLTEWLCLMALMPLLGAVFTTHYAPMCGLLLLGLLLADRLWWPVAGLLVLACLALGGNHYELWGRRVFEFFGSLPLIPCATLALLAVALWLRGRRLA